MTGLDRDALDAIMRDVRDGKAYSHEGSDRVLALLWPVEGVVLTREEAEHVADWHDCIVDQGGEMPAEETELALRVRAGAAAGS